MEETLLDNKESSGEDSSNDTIKAELAEMYVDFLDKQKGGIIATGANLGINLNPMKKDAVEYLLSDTKQENNDIVAKLGKKIKKKLIEKVTGGTLLEYNKQDLNKMKALLIENKDNKAKLEEFKQQLESGIDPTLTFVAGSSVVSSPDIDKNSPGEKKIITNDIPDISTREKVLKSLDDILAQDQKSPIKYTWGSRDITKGVDCSGLLICTWKQAGIQPLGEDSRAIFTSLDPQLVELDEQKKIKKDALKNIKQGDVIFWNSINPDYQWSTGKIPEIVKNNKTYRIHHIAFVEKINYEDGTIDIVESNGSKGVTKSTIKVNDWLTRKEKNQSELYVAHIDYNSIKKTSDQQSDQQLAA